MARLRWAKIPVETAGGTGAQKQPDLRTIPHARFIAILTYKAKLVGTGVVIAEESYTSKASFLDLDALPTYDPERTEKPRQGKREKRGLYRASDGRRIHADINGSYNIYAKHPQPSGRG